jgi:hypothetical protein
MISKLLNENEKFWPDPVMLLNERPGDIVGLKAQLFGFDI